MHIRGEAAVSFRVVAGAARAAKRPRLRVRAFGRRVDSVVARARHARRKIRVDAGSSSTRLLLP